MFSIPAILGLLIGAALGAFSARRRGGNAADIAQYATVFALIGLLAGIALTIALPGPG